MIKATFSIASKIKCSAVNFGFLLVILTLKFSGQSSQEKAQSYINQYSNEAINQMIEYKIPASVILAQAIFESGSGNSILAKRSNNHFGIKCHTTWGGDTIRKSDDSLNECFRSYKNINDSYTDHSLFLKSRTRYKFLFALPVNDYKGWCYGLKSSGYATYAYYPEVLIKIIEQYGLHEFDRTEQLNSRILMCSRKEDILVSNYCCDSFSIKELCANDLLWSDERHLLIQSLEMIIDHSAKELDKIVDN